ncbi:MAG: hypothetical protein K6E78_07425 [Treponema sp.]|nr:hypothetical protein [Treponema sp.]
MNENFHWRHLKSQRWIQESLDRCLVLFCYLYAQNNGDFSKFDWAMDESVYREFFTDLIESKKIEESSLWAEEPIINLVTEFMDRKSKRRFKIQEKMKIFNYFQNFVRFHNKAFSKGFFWNILMFFVVFLLVGFTTILAFRSKQWLEMISEGIASVFCLLVIICAFIRNAVLKRKTKRLLWQYLFSIVDYEFCFFKLSEEIEYVDQKFRYMYEVLEEMVMRKAVLVKIDGNYKIAEGKTLADLLNVMDEYYYKDEELFTPQFIAKNILDSKGNPIRAKSVSEFRSRKREVVE